MVRIFLNSNFRDCSPRRKAGASRAQPRCSPNFRIVITVFWSGTFFDTKQDKHAGEQKKTARPGLHGREHILDVLRELTKTTTRPGFPVVFMLGCVRWFKP